jgi:hypothetical protein
MISKESYTKIFLQQWDKSADEINIKLYQRKWFINNRTKNGGGLRLTDDGYMFLTDELDLKEYEIPFTADIDLSPQTVIFLDRYIDCPYYLTPKSITVFSEKKSFELYLFSGDIRKFGHNKALSKRLSQESHSE